MRGEQTHLRGLCGASGGSPPLARGTVRVYCPLTAYLGITPACAGNSATGAEAKNAPWDHPRLRGEQSVLARGKAPRVGSPPLARGTVRAHNTVLPHRGITPACAGNRYRSLPLVGSVEDHPRLRGEQVAVVRHNALEVGSPPLARGTEHSATWRGGLTGITPACAGNRLKKDLLYLVFYNIVFHFSISFS